MRKITLENQHGIYTIEVKEGIEYIGDYVEQLIIPVLISAGFSTETVNDYLGREEEEEDASL